MTISSLKTLHSFQKNLTNKECIMLSTSSIQQSGQKVPLIRILSLLLLAVTISFAGPGMKGKYGKGMGPMPPWKMEQLNLTAEQKTKLQNFHDQHQKAMIDLQSEKKKLEIDLKSALRADQISKAVVDKIRAALKLNSSARIDHRIDGILFLFSVLTPEQKATFEAISGPRGGRKGGGPGLGKGGPGKGMMQGPGN